MQNKHELLIEAAKKIILLKGYAKTSIEDITTAANIAKGSFYTYFKSKDDLLNDILKTKLEDIDKGLKSILTEPISFEEAIEELIRKRILIEDKDIVREITVLNVIRNIDALRKDTLMLLRKRDDVNKKIIQDILIKYGDQTKIELKDIHRYSEMINGIIDVYRMKELFLEPNMEKGFIRDIDELKKKILSEKTLCSIKFIKRSIMKIVS